MEHNKRQGDTWMAKLKMKEILEFDGREAVEQTSMRLELNVPLGTWYGWRRKGLLPKPIRLGKYRYFWRDEVMARLARGE
jgi:hypothetical protein